MISILTKEILTSLYNRRFMVLLLLGIVICSSSMIIGYVKYDHEKKMYDNSLAHQNALLAQTSYYQYMTVNLSREPERLSIFNSGVGLYFGRFANVNSPTIKTFKESPAAKDPVMAMFGSFDLTFVVTHLFTLLAFMLSYDSISGEKESGTLKLIQSNSIRRSAHVLGIYLGRIISVIVLVLLSVLVGLVLLLLLFPIEFTSTEWGQIGLMIVFFLLLTMLCTLGGSVISTFFHTRQSSLLLSLLVWIVLIFVIPSLSSTISAAVDSPILRQEFEAQVRSIRSKDEYRLDWRLSDYLKENPTPLDKWDNGRPMKIVQAEVEQEMMDEFLQLWYEYFRRRQQSLQTYRLLSSLSPVSATRHAINAVTGTGYDWEFDLNQLLLRYAPQIAKYVWDKTLGVEKIPDYRRSISFDASDEGIFKATYNEDYSQPTVDLKDMPKYHPETVSTSISISGSLWYGVALVVMIIVALIVGMSVFNRYDVR